MHTSSKFVLHGGDGAFADRQKKLFEQLSKAEKECNKDKGEALSTYPSMEVELDNMDRLRRIPRAGLKRKCETRQFRGKESIFKRPEGPAPRNIIRSIPDHHRNPHKWVKYSLDDVPNEDMTDRSCAQAAFSFLRELKSRREDRDKEMECEDEDSEKDKIVFKSKKNKPSLEFRKPECAMEKSSGPKMITHDDKPVFRSSKVLMPEYVVGQKPKKKEKKEKREKLPVMIDRTKQLKLKHLEEVEEEDI